MKRELLSLWLVLVLVVAVFSGGMTMAVLSDTEEAQVTIDVAGNGAISIAAGNAQTTSTGNVSTSDTNDSSSVDPGIDYVAFVSNDNNPGVWWEVENRNDEGEPKSIFWTASDVDYVVVGYEYDGQNKVNIYDYTTRDGVVGTATSLGSSNPNRTIANVTSYNVSSALGVNETAEEANDITYKQLDSTNNITASTTLKIAYDESTDKFDGELAGTSDYTLPRAVDDSYETTEDKNLSVNAPGILENDTVPEDLSLMKTTRESNGNLTLFDTGGFTYEPNDGFNGTDSFTYRLSDGIAADTATVNITVAESSS